MRATLADARLARYAGRFVWLALDFDRPDNAAFFDRHATSYTPTFYVLDPSDERATATQIGAMTVLEVEQFLDRGARELTGSAPASRDAELALARGDAALATARRDTAAEAYADALRLGGAAWPERERAVGGLISTLMLLGRSQPCAEFAAGEAPRLDRGAMFGRVIVDGLTCARREPTAAWAARVRGVLEPLAIEALALAATARDHRVGLYLQLIAGAESRSDRAAVAAWGQRGLDELDAIHPAGVDERAALDIARVELARAMDDPVRAIPALIASERSMPTSYVASLRLAQLELDAQRYDDAIAACQRGLAHAVGPLARAWLLQMEADALNRIDHRAEARAALEQALQAARAIPIEQARQRNLDNISRALR